MTHLAITIGPIYKTIQKARRTRDIWAASFIFSLMMKEILKQLERHPKVATVLTPDTADIKVELAAEEEENPIQLKTYHGAGIYPDRCFVQLKEAFTDQEMLDFRNAVYEKLPRGLGRNKKYFHLYAVQGNFSDTVVHSKADKDNIIFQLTKVLEDMELQQKFIQSDSPDMVKQLDDHIQDLYEIGMAEDDQVFIPTRRQKKSRLPSIIEISTKGLSNKPYYSTIVTDQVWTNIRKSKKKREDTDDSILAKLKAKLKSEEIAAFKARYKYYAIVQSDGDSVGKIIAEMGNDATAITEFSKKLMTFSKEAAKDIAAFGAIPVYIGGDDLLFIAPLINAAGKDIFQLTAELGAAFKTQMTTATLSFGIAINYYKHPMSKALETSYGQLFYGAKKWKATQGLKNALAFLVRKHSGQHFGSILPKKRTAFTVFLAMIKKYTELDTTFLSATMYTLQEQEFLLVKALETQRLDYFFENNFNETRHITNKDFLKDVKKLARAIHEDMEGVEANDTWKKYLPKEKAISKANIMSNTLFSCLRLIQFLNANDHE